MVDALPLGLEVSVTARGVQGVPIAVEDAVAEFVTFILCDIAAQGFLRDLRRHAQDFPRGDVQGAVDGDFLEQVLPNAAIVPRLPLCHKVPARTVD